ncbi:MAG: OmpA family protein [Alphaproteobacteria bacterium]|nr:OmpA family protein [Alphaproteobacteria bacterium]
MVCPANDLWLSERNERTDISDVYSGLTLRDGNAEKTFTGNGTSGGEAGAYEVKLQRLFPRQTSNEMDRVRRAIIRDYGTNMGDRIFFGTNETNLKPDAKHLLDRMAFYLVKRPNLRLLLEGHTDDRGSANYNMTLANRRAKAAKDYLAKHGVDPLRIDIVSLGKDRPAVIGTNEPARAQNRRVVFSLERLL